MDGRSRLLLLTHVPIRTADAGGAMIDDQTAAGIRQWARYFEQVTYYGVAEDVATAAGASAAWVDARDDALGPGTRVRALPRAYRLPQMMRALRSTRALLRAEVARHDHLCFTIGGLIGNWPALGALESIGRRRRYAAWIDRVEPSVIRNRLRGAPVAKRLAGTVLLPTMEHYTRYLLRHSAVALLQGRDTYDHYAAFAPRPFCTYDTHTQASDQIEADALAQKRAAVGSGKPLDIVYVGRADVMKGPDDWIEVLDLLRRRGVPFRATWMGDGPHLAAMKERVAQRGLTDAVAFTGFVGDRDRIMAAMRRSDLLLFCHKTAESARCLVEALVAGCPLVGYGSAYARGLIERHGGGRYVAQDDVAALAEAVVALAGDRSALADLIGAAATSGTLYTEDLVYGHRAELMRQG